MPDPRSYDIPSGLRERVAEIGALTDAFALAHLDAEYAELAQRMAAKLAWVRPSPLERGPARTWAAAIVHAVGWVNFLADPAQTPHLSASELAARAGVGQRTIAAAFAKIRSALDLMRMNPEWTRPSRLAENPLAWMIEVNGIPMDARDAPPEVQREAFERGLMPYLPEREPSPLADAVAEMDALLERTLRERPDATDEDLAAALQRGAADYNTRAQPELGGLSPIAVHRLLDADWRSAESAVRIDESASLAELESSPILHDARLFLAMLAEQREVTATPKGNLPRAFVATFRERMRRPPASGEAWRDEIPARNEEDFFPLHVLRLLLDLAGLLKRQKGVFTRTRRGERLAGEPRAGELLATLLRAQFRSMNLAYLDGASPAPGFQYGIGYALYQFARAGDDWRTPAELTDALVLPFVREELRPHAGFDEMALILETRFLRPLERFGLAEGRGTPRRAGDLVRRTEYRKAPLLERVVRFDLG